MSETAPISKLEKINESEIDLDKIPELEKGKNGNYFLEIPRIHPKKEFTQLYLRKMEIEAIGQKRTLHPKHKQEYRQIEQKLAKMKQVNQDKFKNDILDLIIRSHSGEFGPGKNYNVKYSNEKSVTLGTKSKNLIPLGSKQPPSVSINGSKIITPYDTSFIERLKKMDTDTIEAQGYFVEVH